MKKILIVACVAFLGCKAHESKQPINPPEPCPEPSGVIATVSPERAIASKLGLKPRFAFGLGNDAIDYNPNNVSAYTVGPKVDIHYMYLSNLDWPQWNKPEGAYVTMHVNAAKARGVVPMFTLYQAAAWNENNLSAFNDPGFMSRYWANVRIMFQRLNEGGVPNIVHVEPDLWGYFQKKSNDPAAIPVKVSAMVPECSNLPSNVAGFGKCIVRLSRKLSPKTIIGLHASSFGAYTDGEPDPGKVGAYLRSVGGAEADITVVEMSDRDAGCFETAIDPLCQRSGTFYWSTDKFRDHLSWAKTIRIVTGKPLLWWQLPLGVPSTIPGGTAGKYRDNRVQYVFSRAWEFAQAGGIGAVFGTGAKNQTTVQTDGGQFKDALSKYLSYGGNGLN